MAAFGWKKTAVDWLLSLAASGAGVDRRWMALGIYRIGRAGGDGKKGRMKGRRGAIIAGCYVTVLW